MHDGETLTLLRRYKKLSQTKLAKCIDKSQEMISYWEKQEHLDGKTLELLLKGLNSNKEEWKQFKKLPPQNE